MPAESPLRAGGDDSFELIETFRFEPGRGFIRLERHLARMAASAEALGFEFSLRSAETRLSVLNVGRTAQRIRMSLNRKGQITIAAEPYAALPADIVWRLKFAKTRLDSRDPLLRHKTSRRDIYARARAEFSAQEADEVLLLNEKDEVCEGCITNIFLEVPYGGWLTPALECGLLPGVLRQEMLRNKDAAPVHLSVWEVATTPFFWVGNSLRGLIRARILE
jgi:4-amino-4-deoxychorismate lyase